MKKNYYYDSKKLILEKLKSDFEQLDNVIFKRRNKEKYAVEKIKKRTIITRYGLVIFKRRIYSYYNTNTNKSSYVPLLDRSIGLKKWKRISSDVIDHVSNFLGDGKRYRDIADTMDEKISLMSIHRIFKNKKINICAPVNKIKLLNQQKLYINTDDCFLNFQYNRSAKGYQIRVFSFNTGKIKFGEKNVLLNKRVSFYTQKSSQKINKSYYLNRKKLVNWTKNQLSKYYENWEKCELIVGGDGASWIKTLAKGLNAKLVICKLHVLQKLRDTFLIVGNTRNDNGYKYPDYDSYSHFWKSLKNNNPDDLIHILENYKLILKSKKIYVSKINKANVFIRYIKNNYESFLNYYVDWNIGVSAESVVFHLVKSLRGSGAKIYNHEVFKNMLAARTNQINSRVQIN